MQAKAGKSSKTVIKVEKLTKTFRIPTEASSGIKQKIINLIKGKKGYREFTPLKDISFEIKEGDFFGIVGRNGSGKSTLLKSIANIYNPTSGQVHVDGTLVPFIELGVGFNPELTGRENVFLNGALLGFSHDEMEAMYDDIVDFAEIEDFMDEKLKNYSSGMQVRLAFSIAIQAKGDILLLDEVLAVGDEAFQRKCFNYFAELKRDNKTVVLVTHDMGAVQKYCTKAMMIDKGGIAYFGDVFRVADAYRDQNSVSVKKNSSESEMQVIKKIFDLDSINEVSLMGKKAYKATKDKKSLFIKKSDDDFRNEFEVASLLYKTDNNYFIEPIATHEGLEGNYILTHWKYGVGLDRYVNEKKIKSNEKTLLLEDLFSIGELLYEAGVVHRDLIPRNFLVVDGRLVLIDFQWAVSYETYSEIHTVREDILHLGGLGEQFAKGKYEWDDAYSLEKIGNYIIGGQPNSHQEKILSKIRKRAGERVITPTIETFSNSLNKQHQEIIELKKEIKDNN